MLETIVVYSARLLPSIIICLIGVAIIKNGFKLFGIELKIQLWSVFLVLYFVSMASAALFGLIAIQQKIPVIAILIFFIGILFWIVALFFGVWFRKESD